MWTILALLLSLPPIDFPSLPPTDPLDTTVTEVPKGAWYVIQSAEPLELRGYPSGLVAVKSYTGNQNFIGRFAGSVDGADDEERSYPTDPQYKHIYTVRGIAPGSLTLVAIPLGFTSPTEITEKPLKIVGLNPRPGPEPNPGPFPEPEPRPEPLPTAQHVSVNIIFSVTELTPDQAIIKNAMPGWTELLDAGHDWRIFAPSTTEPRGKEALAKTQGISIPALYIKDKDTGKDLFVGPLPATFPELKDLIARLTNGR